MSTKHTQAAQYDRTVTSACETALVLLLQAFGSYKTNLRLIGGLVPRYLVEAAPPEIPVHAGTTDVDIVLDVAILAAGEDYSSLRDQLKNGGFIRHTTTAGHTSSWQWECSVSGTKVLIEFLVDTAIGQTGLVSIDGEAISACRIPHAGMASQWYLQKDLQVEMPNGDGIATETIRFADPVAYIALKGLAMQNRYQAKDVADIVYVLRHVEGSAQAVAATYAQRLPDSTHGPGLRAALETLQKDFCSDAQIPGHRKSGPGRYVNFHGIQDADERERELRNVSGLVDEFLGLIAATGAWTRPPRT